MTVNTPPPHKSVSRLSKPHLGIPIRTILINYLYYMSILVDQVLSSQSPTTCYNYQACALGAPIHHYPLRLVYRGNYMKSAPNQFTPQPFQRVVHRVVPFTLFTLFFCNTSFAQQPPGTITYGPLTTAIPTLSGYGLIILAGLMIITLWVMKKNGKFESGRFLGVALILGAFASMSSGIKLVTDAYAVLPIVQLDNPAGGTKPLESGLNCVQNTTQVPQQIIDIQINSNASSQPTTNGVSNEGACTTNGGTVPPCSDAPQKTILNTNDICAVCVGCEV